MDKYARKYRAIIKRPDESFGHMTNISITLENLQKLVGGYIEIVNLDPIKKGLVLICNEEGKNLKLPYNMPHPLWPDDDFIVGEIVLLGADGEDLTDVPIEFASWKEIIKKIKEVKE